MLTSILASVISIAVSPQSCMAPCQIQVKVRIEKAEASDKARMEISDVASTDLVVEEGKRTYVLPNSRGFYTVYEPGNYTIIAYLARRGEKLQSAVATLMVGGAEPAQRLRKK